MNDPDPAGADAVSSPCVGICASDCEGICVGCFRSRAEIAVWGVMSERQRREIMDQVLPLRRQRYFD